MKKLIYLTLLLLSFAVISHAQEVETKSRKELREERQQKRIKEVKELIENKSFVFKATHALPMAGASIPLDFSFDAELKNDTLISYLPFFGVAYSVDYGGRDAAFDFTLPVENIEIKETDNGFQVKFDVKKKTDYMNFIFNISDPGYATLKILSTNRQAISYYGSIEAP
jgi:hypothetical protein